MKNISTLSFGRLTKKVFRKKTLLKKAPQKEKNAYVANYKT